MNSFSYIRADRQGKAIEAVSRNPDASFLAGGTNLIDYMKEGVVRPDCLVDIRNLPLAGIEERDNGLRLGALATNTAVAYHPFVIDRYPLLSEALLSGASPQLRNVATVAGNILQKTRCEYYRDLAWHCNKRSPGAGCSALSGCNRSHAVLGVSDACIASHPSDFCVALAALDPIVHICGPQRVRSLQFSEFHCLPGATPHIETVLEPGELIIAVDLPALPFARQSCYLKVRDRASFEFALASAAVALDLNGSTIIQARVGLGGIATKPWRSHAAEAVLQNRPIEERSFREAADAALQDAHPLAHNGFKVELAKRTLIRALATAAHRKAVA